MYPIRLWSVFPSVLIILQVRNCGSQLDSGFGFLSGVPCGRAIPLPDFWHMEAISCSFRCRISRSLFDSHVSDEFNFHRQRAGSLCISQHVEAVWRYQLSVQVKIKFRVHTLLMFESVSFPILLGHQLRGSF